MFSTVTLSSTDLFEALYIVQRLASFPLLHSATTLKGKIASTILTITSSSSRFLFTRCCFPSFIAFGEVILDGPIPPLHMSFSLQPASQWPTPNYTTNLKLFITKPRIPAGAWLSSKSNTDSLVTNCFLIGNFAAGESFSRISSSLITRLSCTFLTPTFTQKHPKTSQNSIIFTGANSSFPEWQHPQDGRAALWGETRLLPTELLDGSRKLCNQEQLNPQRHRCGCIKANGHEVFSGVLDLPQPISFCALTPVLLERWTECSWVRCRRGRKGVLFFPMLKSCFKDWLRLSYTTQRGNNLDTGINCN